MSIRVIWRVDTRLFKNKLERVRRQIESDIQGELFEAGGIVAAEQERRAPVRKGGLRGSIEMWSETPLSVTIGPKVSYAPFVVRATAPSPGRYVPAIDKRLVDPTHPSYGVHPGTPAIPFVDEARKASVRQVIERLTSGLRRIIE